MKGPYRKWCHEKPRGRERENSWTTYHWTNIPGVVYSSPLCDSLLSRFCWILSPFASSLLPYHILTLSCRTNFHHWFFTLWEILPVLCSMSSLIYLCYLIPDTNFYWILNYLNYWNYLGTNFWRPEFGENRNHVLYTSKYNTWDLMGVSGHKHRKRLEERKSWG